MIFTWRGGELVQETKMNNINNKIVIMACKIIISWEDIATRENLEHPSSAG